MSESGEPLICDFGISRMLDSSQSLFNSTTHGGDIKGSTRWMAIELLNAIEGKEPKHSKETDVWAYGMTLYVRISFKSICTIKSMPACRKSCQINSLISLSKLTLP